MEPMVKDRNYRVETRDLGYRYSSLLGYLEFYIRKE